MNRIACLRHAVVYSYEAGGTVCTKFADQTWYGAFHHPNDPHYHVISHRCGYGDDLASYCFEHEVAHCFSSEFLYGEPSHVLWCLAHGIEPDPVAALAEELRSQLLQRYARAGEEPIVSGVDWLGMRDGFLRHVS